MTITDHTPQFNLPVFGKPQLIGLSGYARSGKDSVASVLGNLYGYQRVAFADNLKKFVREINPIVDVTTWTTDEAICAAFQRVADLVAEKGDTRAKEAHEYRRLLQETGTQARNMFGEDVWINAALRNLSHHDMYVITDVRFQNEALTIVENGGVVYRVTRPGIGPANDHISERDLDDWEFDAEILNDGSLLELEGEIQRVLGDLG